MKIGWKHIILLLLVQSCRENASLHSDDIPALLNPPLMVALDTTKGYLFNPISNDSIKPFVNDMGITVQTGTPFFLEAVKKNTRLLNSKNINQVVPQITTTGLTTFPVKGKPEIIMVNVDLFNKNADENPNKVASPGAKTIPAIGVKVSLHEPQPVKVSPMAIKDNATTDIHYFDVAQGLPYSYVTDIIEDKKGNIWMAIDGNGVCKYDGLFLTPYTQKEGLIDNGVTSLMEDDKGNIWIGTNAGISVFDGNSFTQFTEKEGLPDNRILNFTKNAKGNIWITFGKGLAKFDGQYFTIYSEKDGLPHNREFFCTQDSRGRIWMSNEWGVTLFDGKKFVPFHNELDFLKNVYSIAEDNKGNIWFGAALYGLIKYDGKTFTHYSKENGLTDNSIIELIKDRKGNIWIATRYGGIMKFDGTNFTVYGQEQGLSENKTKRIMEDSRGNIWIATLGGGVNKLNENSFSQKILLKDLGGSRVRPIVKDNYGNLWFGTEDRGLYQYNGSKLKTFISGQTNGLNGFRSMMADTKGNLWFGESGGNFYKYYNKQLTYHTFNQNSAGNISLFEASGGTVWMGTQTDGVIAFNETNFIHYTVKDGFPAEKVFVTTEDKKGNLWFGTDAGLVRYDGKYFTMFSARQGFFGKAVTSVIEDNQGNLWLGTLGAGLCKFNGKQFIYYTEKQGLSYNDVWSVIQDSAGQIWAGTDKGLSLLVPAKDSAQAYTVYNFGLEDGLKATDFNLHSVCIDNDNRIWWGTGKALVSRDLNKPFTTANPRSLSLNQVLINGQFYDFRNLPDSMSKKISFSNVPAFSNCPNKLVLAYNQNHLNFSFTAIDLQAPHKLQYSYRLTGWANVWSVPSSATTAEFRNLPHGNYELQVKAIGQSKEWTKPIRFLFTILPPWWLTWWFKTIVGLSAIGFIFLIVRFIYQYQLRKQKIVLEKQLAVQSERQRISAEMHDDIGAGLSGIRLLTEMTKNKIKDTQAAEEVEKIYQSVGDISSKMKEVIWSLNTENDTLSNLLTYLQLQAKAMLEHYPCHLITQIPEYIPAIPVDGETRRNIFLVVKEVIHNIIKHSGADKVILSMNCKENDLYILISDNGRGINDKEKNENGNGMKNIKKRIGQMQGKMYLNKSEGVALTFKIPLKNEL